jgi:hypothetical protein
LVYIHDVEERDVGDDVPTDVDATELVRANLVSPAVPVTCSESQATIQTLRISMSKHIYTM